MEQNIKELFDFIKESPTGFHAVGMIAKKLEEAGFIQRKETDAWEIVPNGKYYVKRGDSALIAFCVPKEEANRFCIMASHSDSPTFRLKPNPEMEACGAYTMLNTEPYGGGIYHTWMDRPLSVAGRVVVKTSVGLESRFVFLDRDLLIIPSLAIHMNREVNRKLEMHAQKDLLPLFGDAAAKGMLTKLIAQESGCKEEDIFGEDLFLCSRVQPTVIGAQEEYLCGPRLDDLECVFGSLQGFLKAAAVFDSGTPDCEVAATEENSSGIMGCERSDTAPQQAQGTSNPIPVFCVFDNEEVGSQTRQGAASTFLADTLERICIGLCYDREKYHRMIAKSFLVSADNAHAVHPASVEKADPVNRPVMNGGLVLKYSANQRYTTDGASAAYFRAICREAGVPVQDFSNHSDIPGGSTLGNISITQVPVASVDIGLAQLSMHSACETAGAKDLTYLIRFAEKFFLN